MVSFSRRNTSTHFHSLSENLSYISVPENVSFSSLVQKKSLSPTVFREVSFKNKRTKKVSELINAPIKGVEVGSDSYVDDAPTYFIRNRALQETSYLLTIDSVSVLPIKPQSFQSYDLKRNDIVYSKDSNIGECCIIEYDDFYKNYMISSGLLKLVAREHPLYLFAFLKHEFVKSQLECMTPPFSTIRHSGSNFMSCLIPFPEEKNAEKEMAFVEGLVQDIIDCERTFREKDSEIINLITKELSGNQNTSISFLYEFPKLSDLITTHRIDAGIHSRQYKERMFLVSNYSRGYKILTSDKLGFQTKPGPSLEYKIIKTRVDSKDPIDGYYTLILPTDISDFGTIDKLRYMGTARELPQLKFGDIIIGESGTWRSMVILSEYQKPITNAHGSLIRSEPLNLVNSIFARCMLSWYKKIGVFDYLSVGGSGGHLSPSYFDRILIPNFPDELKERIAKLYYDKETSKGVAQLNEMRLNLQGKLDSALDDIINNRSLSFPQ